MYKYRFSIFTATFNRAELLLPLAQCVEHQTYRGGYEWIIVSDGSTDNTAAVVSKIKENTAITIKFVDSKENKGKHAAWREATKLFEGQYVVTCDDDDPVSLEMLEIFDRYWKMLEQSPDYNQFWEVRARCQYEDGRLVGPKLPSPWLDSDYNEVTFKMGKGCEMDSCRKVEVLRAEAAVPDSFLFEDKCSNYGELLRWSKAARKYKSRFVPDIVRTYVIGHNSLCTTVKGGTPSTKKIYNSLVGALYSLNECGDLLKKYQLRQYLFTILTLSYSAVRVKEPVTKYLNSNLDKALTFFAYIPAYAIYAFRK